MRSAWQLRHQTIARALAALATAAPLGCSLLYDLNADQCDSDSDCKRFGARVCQSGVCVADDSNTPGGQPSGEAGSSAAGAGEPPAECGDHGECIDDHFGEPYLCLQGRCVSLKTKECPTVVGTENLRAPEPIVFGAYALASSDANHSNVTRNIELVVSEITNKVDGLRGGPDGTDRKLAFVICNSSFPDVAPGTIDAFVPSLDHLLGTLQVPGILSALSAKDLRAVFKQRLDAAGTFVISPYEQDSELASLSDDSRLWHMLGATSDLAPAFVPLLQRTETYLRRDESFLNISGGKLRVALVAANVARELDIRDALLEAPALADFDVEPFQFESALLNADPDISSAINGIFDFAPNIIIALAGSEFIEKGFPVLESGTTWGDRTLGQQRPMYLLGSTMGPQTWALYGTKQGEPGGWKTFFDRVVGVAYASAQDPRLLRGYEARLIAANDDVTDTSLLLGSESVYDAAYLLIYATAAAGDLPQPRGKDLAAGMRRLVEGTTYDVGPSSISGVLTALDNGEDIGLNLTLGPADWNIARGTRNGVGSVYCLGNSNSPDEPQGPVRDVLRYDPGTGELENKALICIPDF